MMIEKYREFYRSSLALLTDLYELTMAYGYWKLGIGNRPAVFHLFFRRRPFSGNFAIVAGLEFAMQFIENFHFEPSDLAYLESLKTYKGRPLFEKKFLDELAFVSFGCDIDAMEEGTAVFPNEPIIRVKGPLFQAQLLESALLNIINYQTLIATKAARVCMAAEGDEVVEFGLRRAQGIDGALSGSRAAYIGGCHSTSNVLAGKYFGIPVKGTHAHSWIMAFDEEEESFDKWTEVMPGNCIYLVDTYDTVKGVKKAIAVAKKQQHKAVEMLGVRLDSGDLAELSVEIRKLLDQEGFYDTKIMASNELDELIIRDLKKQGAKVDLWGVGTHLITGKDQPALDGVYKLSAIQDEKGVWLHKIKLSEQFIKTTNPGILQVRRYYQNSMQYRADMIYDTIIGLGEKIEMVNPLDLSKKMSFSSDLPFKELLLPMFREGKRVYSSPPLQQIRQKTLDELAHFSTGVRRFLNPHFYFVGLEKSLYDLKMSLIERIKAKA